MPYLAEVYPKRCSYAQGLAVEPRTAAIARIRAALAARDEMRAEATRGPRVAAGVAGKRGMVRLLLVWRD